ncbi:response regulator transcription factor [Pedobacter sp. MW01-1-1]|uniref:response regulator transcription factor n=1 Tax=Pedobacter sp. MW01-1-1 TaxID=3383027 RepID=UPI003FEF3345
MDICIIDSHQLLSELLKMLLLDSGFVKSVNVYDNAEKFFAHLKATKPTILITDMVISDMTGIQLITQIRKQKSKSELKIIVLTSISNPNTIREAFKSGANGYLCKNASTEEFLEALKFVDKEDKKPYVGESLKEILVQSQLLESSSDVVLSPREKELLHHVCSGKTVKEIAIELELSPNTIQSYMRQLMFKMEVNRMPDLILKAIDRGLFLPNSLA